MITIADLFPPDHLDHFGAPVRSDEQVAKMQRRIASAYEALFNGKGSKEDAELVVIDLAQFTRYLDTTQLGTSDEVLREINGRRSVFARVVEAIIGAGGNLDGLHRAVLATPVLTEEN